MRRHQPIWWMCWRFVSVVFSHSNGVVQALGDRTGAAREIVAPLFTSRVCDCGGSRRLAMGLPCTSRFLAVGLPCTSRVLVAVVMISGVKYLESRIEVSLHQAGAQVAVVGAYDKAADL